jgi:Tol biopolymer transport system component/DNA-binding winged helix-turn-helix (wHTH) protein
MSLETKKVKFGEFLFDAKEKVLFRQGKPVSITPKTFELLIVLVKNHGHLVEKNDLMKAVWTDSFVEESNLTYTISLLRIALGDEKRNPRFIETVSRRGYRFIAEVGEITEENSSNNGAVKTLSEPPEKKSADSLRFKKLRLPAAIFLIVGVMFVGVWFTRSQSQAAAPILFAAFVAEKLTTNGKTLHAVISPDGKNVIYTQGSGGDKQSVWLRQLDTGNNVEIVPPSDDFYYGLALSPDGNFLYLVRCPRGQTENFNIFRVSIFGGIPQKILSQTEGWISISPDGTRISFVRCPGRNDENCSLFIADSSNGENEKKLVSRPRPLRIGDNEFLPDGKSVVFAVGHSETQANEFGLMEVEIESGAEREVSPEKFFNIQSLTRLPDRSGLLIAASRTSTGRYRIWLISPDGKAAPLTNDSESYWGLSLDKSASRLISIQIREDYRLQIFETENPLQSRSLAEATRAAFAPNGKILFGSMMSGNYEIWSVNRDGGGQRQLTNNPADENEPMASSADNSIFFVSNRTGEMQIWKMDADGGNQRQITRTGGGEPLLVSPDGRWLYYHQNFSKSLWRVAAEGGEEELMLDKRKHHLAVSPDASQAVFTENQNGENVLMIVRLADGQTVKILKYADERTNLFHLKWSADGNSLVYILAASEYENNTLWRQSLDGSSPQKIADLGNERIAAYALAPDGKNFAVSKGGWRHDAVLLKGLR